MTVSYSAALAGEILVKYLCFHSGSCDGIFSMKQSMYPDVLFVAKERLIFQYSLGVSCGLESFSVRFIW